MNFIGEYQINNITVCDNLISYFENNPERQNEGVVGLFSMNTVDKKIKDSTDISIHPSEFELPENKEVIEYLKQLDICIDVYAEEYPTCNNYGPWAIEESINIRKYDPGQGFKSWHTERCNAAYPTCHRHLAFMTYLNDVYYDGGTEFKNQNKTYKARKGKTLIWPTDWTHTHRGIVSKSKTKYIVTGWFSYY